MANHRLAESQPLGDGGAHVVRRQVVHQVVLQQQGHQREAAHQIADERQRRMVQEVQRLLPGALVRKVQADEAAHGEPFQPHGKVEQQQGAKRIAGDGVADKNQKGTEVVHQSPVADGLERPQRNADRIGDDQSHQPIVEGHRKPLADDIPDRLVVAVGIAQIALGHPPHPNGIALQQGAVEAIVGTQPCQLGLGQRHAGARHLAGGARRRIDLLGFHDGPLQRAARHQPGDGEDNDRHPQEGWRD